MDKTLSRLLETLRWMTLDRPPGMHGRATRITSHRNSQAHLRRAENGWTFRDESGRERPVDPGEAVQLVHDGEFIPVTVHLQPDIVEALFKRAVTLAEDSVARLNRVSAAIASQEQANQVMLYITNAHELDEALASAMMSTVSAVAAAEAQCNAWAGEAWTPRDSDAGVHKKLSGLVRDRCGKSLRLDRGPLDDLSRAVDRRNHVIHGSTDIEELPLLGALVPGRTESLRARKACLAVRQSLIIVARELGEPLPPYLAFCPAGRPDDDAIWQAAIVLTGVRHDPDFQTVAESAAAARKSRPISPNPTEVGLRQTVSRTRSRRSERLPGRSGAASEAPIVSSAPSAGLALSGRFAPMSASVLSMSAAGVDTGRVEDQGPSPDEVLRRVRYGGAIHPAPDPYADHEAALLQMLDDFLAGALPFEKLERRFGDYIVHRLPGNALPEEIYEFFDDVHEQLCFWTAREPTAEDRHYGWIDVKGFTRWLAAKGDTFPGR